MNESAAMREMPKYRCHKEVWALKIASIIAAGTATPARIVPADKGYGEIQLSDEYMDKHKPEAGGYYVVYADGYKSYSPADAFEGGYTLIDGTATKSPSVNELSDWDRINEAANRANNAFGQWMPERWLQMFVGFFNDLRK